MGKVINHILAFAALIFLCKSYSQDTLSKKTFLELDRLAVAAHKKGDTVLSRLYSYYHRNKAKREKDSLEVAFSFYIELLSDDANRTVQFADSTIIYSENSKSKYYPTYGYLRKARALFKLGLYREALDNYLIAYELAKAKGNESHISSVNQGMAMIKSNMGDYTEALKLYQEDYQNSLRSLDSKLEQKNYPVSIRNLALIFLKKNDLDSARFYAEKGLKEFRDDEFHYIRLVSALSQIDYYSENLNAAYDSMQKFRHQYTGNRLANNYYYSGKIKHRQGNDSLAKLYLSLADSIVTSTNRPFPEIKDAYQILADLHGDEPEKKLAYIGKYIWADSILTANRTAISPIIEQKFDTPRMLAERDLLLEVASKNKQEATIWTVFAVLFSIIAGWFFIKLKREQQKTKYLAEVGLQTSLSKQQHPKKNEDISPELYKELLRKLELFEKNREFEDVGTKVETLAQKWETNSTTLSKFINQATGGSFPSYLKRIRIESAVERLRQENKLMTYTIDALSSEFGFGSRGSFSRAFADVTGIKPSQFIKELKRRS